MLKYILDFVYVLYITYNASSVTYFDKVFVPLLNFIFEDARVFGDRQEFKSTCITTRSCSSAI